MTFICRNSSFEREIFDNYSSYVFVRQVTTD